MEEALNYNERSCRNLFPSFAYTNLGESIEGISSGCVTTYYIRG